MKGIITVAGLACLIVVSGCTTDGTETETTELRTASQARTINYTAWACEGYSKTVTGGKCKGFHSFYGPGRDEAERRVQEICPGDCRIISVEPGCASLTLKSRRVVRPRC